MASFEELFPVASGRASVGTDAGVDTSGMSDYTRGLYNNYDKIARYMDERFGMTERDYSKEDIIESYENQMRGFNAGQSIVTIGELNYLNSGDEEQRQQRRMTADEAYSVWDANKSALSSGTFGEQVDAVRDYARALIVDPVNLASLGAGKLVATGATKAATQSARAIAKNAAIEAAKQAAKKGITGKARTKAVEDTFRRTLAEQFSTEAYRTASKTAAREEIFGSTVFDVAASMGINVGFQETQILTGRQEGLSGTEVAFAGAGGVAGGMLAGVLNKLRGTSDPIFASIKVKEGYEARAARQAMDGYQPKVDVDKAKEGVQRSRDEFKTWTERRLAGQDVSMFKGDSTVQNDVVSVFFLGDKETGIKGVVDILQEAGFITRKTADDTNFTERFLNDIATADKELGGEISDLFEEVVGPFNPTKVTLNEFLDLEAKNVSEKAFGLGLLGNISQRMEKALKAGSTNPAQAVMTEAVEDIKADGILKNIGNTQDYLIRAIVTNPATTALNVLGWAKASSTQSITDLIQSALYGTAAMANYVIGRGATADKYRKMAGGLARTQIQKTRNFLDPYATQEEMLDYLALRPEAGKEMFRYLVGGIEDNKALQSLKVNFGDAVEELKKRGVPIEDIPQEGLLKTSADKYLEVFQKLYAVRSVDFITKSIEFRNAIDRNLVKEFGMSYREFMNDADMVGLLTKEGDAELYQRFAKVEAAAVREALENTFSRSFADNRTTIGRFAGFIEGFRKTPVVGVLIPFGQFFNNTVNFMVNTSGVGLAAYPFRKAMGEPGTKTASELAARAAAGWTMAGYATYQALEDMENGLNWNEQRTSNGDIIDTTYNFPASLFRWSGHVLARVYKGEGVPEELMNDFSRVFGTESAFRGLQDAGQVFDDIIAAFREGDTVVAGTQEALTEVLKQSVVLWSSGLTRHLDPANKIAATLRGEDYVAVDRNQGNKMFNQSIRYVDQFYEMLSGEQLAPEYESATSERPRTAAFGSLFGYREVQPRSNIERMFADVNRPNWMNEQYTTDPKASAVLRELALPLLESRATELVDSDLWKSSNIDTKERLLSSILTTARTQTKEYLAEYPGVDQRKTALIADLSNKPQRLVSRYAREMFGLKTSELWKLDLYDLEVLTYTVKDDEENLRDLRKLVRFE